MDDLNDSLQLNVITILVIHGAIKQRVLRQQQQKYTIIIKSKEKNAWCHYQNEFSDRYEC